MKRVLIISPHFPPVNAPDMHRVRQTLPYLKEYGWLVEVIAVDQKYVEANSIDPLLSFTIPDDIPIHYVKAWDVNKTRRFGLGSLSLRSYFHFREKGNELLRANKFDLVYFSTTAFHVMALGPYWKRKFGIPFILDIQDLWRNDYYLDKPKSQRPPKFFISYNIDKYLEAKTIPFADGIISVSEGYCNTFKERYPELKDDQFKVITFGASEHDLDILKSNKNQVKTLQLPPDKINIVYVGRGGYDMQFAIEIIFKAFKKGLAECEELFSCLYFSFIGTCYSPAGQGWQTILPIAKQYNVEQFVMEVTDRVSYFETLELLQKADVHIIFGSTDPFYTASKIYPYILLKKPMLAVFHKDSSVVNILNDLNYGKVVTFSNELPPDAYVDTCFNNFKIVLSNIGNEIKLSELFFDTFTAKKKTKEQVDFFEEIIKRNN